MSNSTSRSKDVDNANEPLKKGENRRQRVKERREAPCDSSRENSALSKRTRQTRALSLYTVVHRGQDVSEKVHAVVLLRPCVSSHAHPARFYLRVTSDRRILGERALPIAFLFGQRTVCARVCISGRVCSRCQDEKTSLSLNADMLPVQEMDTLLKQTYGQDFQINDMQWKPLTAPGENFGSVILALNINAEQNNKKRTLNVVVKLPPKSAYLLDLFDSPVTFKKELDFYSIVAPEFVKLQNESGITREEFSVITPRFLCGRLGLRDPQRFDEQAAIVLENLKYHNYVTQDRILGLDKVHLDFAIGHLAKLHAITICMKLKKPEFFEKSVMPVLDTILNEASKNGMIGMVSKAHNDYKNIKEAESYLDRIEKTIEYGFRDSAPAEEPWATLVHNDFWVNNMLFKHDESGAPINMKIVDFQLTEYDYGVNDLIFFLISSSRKEVLDNHLDDMIELYYNSFIDCLKSLNVDTELFPQSKFTEHLNQCAPMKFNQCIMMVQVIQAARGSVTETTETEGVDVFKGGVTDENYKHKLLHVLSTFDRKGWLLS